MAARLAFSIKEIVEQITSHLVYIEFEAPLVLVCTSTWNFLQQHLDDNIQIWERVRTAILIRQEEHRRLENAIDYWWGPGANGISRCNMFHRRSNDGYGLSEALSEAPSEAEDVFHLRVGVVEP